MKRCPFCAEDVQDAAIICRFCGRDLDPLDGVPASAGRALGAAAAAEERLWEGRPALISRTGTVAAGCLLLLGGTVALVAAPELGLVAAIAMGLGVVLIGVAWVSVLRDRYELTSQRAITCTGLFARSSSEVRLEDVRNVVLKTSFADRLLGLGTVGVSTAGQSDFEITFRSVRDPEAVVRLINAHNRSEIAGGLGGAESRD